MPTISLAKPKVAVAPLEGDEDGKLSAAVADVAASDAKVTRPERVAQTLEGAGITTLGVTSAKRLRAKLQVDVVVYGRAGKQRLDLKLSGANMTSSVTFEFGSL